MSKELIRKEFVKLFPNHKHNSAKYREYLVEKYGEEEVKKIEVVNEIVSECLSNMFNESL